MPDKKKSPFARIKNINILFGYISESLGIIKQGYSLKDKIILSRYYLRIPAIIINSLQTGKHFREIEEEKKFLSGNVTLKNKNGIFFCGNNILTVYIINKHSEINLYAYFKINNSCFIDVGAHIGKYSIMLGKNPSAEIISLEPDVYNFDMLQKNILLNNVKNITAINTGAYSSKKEIPFYISGKGEGEHSIYKRNENWETSKIQVDTIDNIIEKLNVQKKISLIKIDAEGAEIEILKGAQKTISKNNPDLIIEVLKENINNLEEVKNILQPFNYISKQIDDDNYFFTTSNAGKDLPD